MGNLRSAVDEEALVDLGALTGPELADRVRELAQERRRMDAEWQRTLGAFDRSGEWALDLARSCGGWVAYQTNVDRGRAHREVRTARRLQRMPKTAAAFAAGELGVDHVEALSAAAHVDGFADGESFLIDKIRDLSPSEARVAVTHWRDVVGDETAFKNRDRRHLYLGATPGGRVVNRFLDAELGARVDRTLENLMALATDLPGEPKRTKGQRRADALGSLCDLYQRGELRGGNQRAHFTVTTDLETWSGHRDGAVQLNDGELLPCSALRRLQCDCVVTRIVLDAESRPIDVGRSTPTVPRWIRRAAEQRDDGCVVPGCGLGAEWCDAHHEPPFQPDGITSVDTVTLLCPRHHTLRHEGHFTVVIEGGTTRCIRRDGTAIGRDPPR